ncbi:hypothetical protein GQ464_016810 [Rhodocaloribacter litoris]|uniref:hypothetical protein n=1 Tax=Rhodocaloribacter litoris TaxID=2558931 RepID=UPI0014211315|nr:hypothetical protein [Rhodocaloribacter litoris]QXD15046.1 hypothetical protein GQ464_016810 [Rhodocaloribacter litoris]
MTAHRMRVMLVVWLVGFGLAATVTAQPRSFDPERMKERLYEQAEDLLKKMELDEATAEKVRPILLAGVDRRMALMRELRGTRPAPGVMQEKMTEIDRETEAQLAGVLTEAQLETYRKLRDEQRAAARRGMRRRN